MAGTPQAAAVNVGSGQASVPVPFDANSGKLILRGRIQNARTAAGLWQSFFFADYQNMQMRAIVQRLIDGFPPYSDGNDRRLGQYGRTNVNWGHVRRAFERICSPYVSILDSMDPLMYIPTNYGTDAQRDYIEPILAEGVTKILKGWSKFNHLWQQTVRLFNAEGVALEFFNDEFDWRWGVQGMQMVKFPRQVQPCIDNMDVWTAQVNMLCSDLFRYIASPKAAKILGWNVEAVKKAIEKAEPLPITASDFQQWQEIYKNLDILPQQTAPMVRTIHTWSKELDGTVSHYISNYDGSGPFLYKKLGKFREPKRFMGMYIYDVGTNGDLHSIRGQPHHLFNAGVAMDRALSAAADAVIQSATPVIKSPNEDALNSLPYRMIGPMMAIDEGWEFEEQKTPPFQQTLLPWYETCKGVFDEQTNDVLSQTKGGPYVSDKQADNQVMAGNQLTSAAMGLFFSIKQQMFREIVRRLARPSYAMNEPGGAEVWQLRTFLLKRGVPLEALYQVDFDGIEVNTGLGRGSETARRVMAETLMGRYSFYDTEGQQKILRFWTASNSTARMARELVPLKPGTRPPQDMEDADNENIGLTSGNPVAAAMVKIKPNQNHEVHCQEHIEALQMLFQLNSQGQLPPDQAVRMMQPCHTHALQHWELMNPASPNKGVFKATLQQMNEFITNETKALAAAQEKAQMQADTGAGQNGSGAPASGGNGKAPPDTDSPGLLRQAVASSQELQFASEKHSLALQEQQNKLQLQELDKARKTQELQLAAMSQ